MKACKFIFALLIPFLLAAPAFASGVIVDTKGKVTVTVPGGKPSPAKIGTELPDGSKVSTKSSSRASLMLLDGSIENIGEKQNYTVGTKAAEKKQRTVIEGIALAMNEATATGSGPTVHGMVKMTQLGPDAPQPVPISLGNVLGPTAIYPVGTVIDLPEKINFKWSMDGKFNFTDPVLVVENEVGKKLSINKLKPTSTSLTLKASKMKLEPGKNYSWYLASREQRKILGKSRRFNFGILSPAEKQKLTQDEQKIMALDMSAEGKQFLMAQLYYRSKMNDKMVETLLPLWNKDQADAVKKLLYLGYVRMGQTDEAVKYH